MKTRLPVSCEELYSNCLFSSIANAVSTIRNPQLSYSQSWDGVNYSFQHGSSRGTITFHLTDAILVGAIRDEKSSRRSWYPKFNAIELFNEAPEAAKVLSTNEALQYLFDEVDSTSLPVAPVGFLGKLIGKSAHVERVAMPVATTALWSEGDAVFSCDTLADFIGNGGEFLAEIMTSANELRTYWEERYCLSSEEIDLANNIFQLKKSGETMISMNSVLRKGRANSIDTNDRSVEGEKEFLKSLVDMGFVVDK